MKKVTKRELIDAILQLTPTANAKRLQRLKLAELDKQLRTLRSLPVARLVPPVAVPPVEKPARKPRASWKLDNWGPIALVTAGMLGMFFFAPALYVAMMCVAILAAFFVAGALTMSTGGIFSLWMGGSVIRTGVDLVVLILSSAAGQR